MLHVFTNNNYGLCINNPLMTVYINKQISWTGSCRVTAR